MKDNVSQPNLGQANKDYDAQYFWNSYRAIEQWMGQVVSKGDAQVAHLSVDEFELNGNATIDGSLTVGGVPVLPDSYVKDTGDTMTGNLTISGSTPALNLNAAGTTGQLLVRMMRDSKMRWFMYTQSGSEPGGNAGSDFGLARADDTGTYIDSPIYITRATGRITVNGDPTAPLGIATKQYVDTAAALPPRLGANAQVITDWNTAVANGWYEGNAAANAPPTTIVSTTAWVYGRVESFGAGYTIQTVWPTSTAVADADTKTAMRVQSAGVWSAWFRVRLSETEMNGLYAGLAAANTFTGANTFSNTSTSFGVGGANGITSMQAGMSIELGAGRTADGYSYIDFHSQAPDVDYSARIIRNPGANGALQINNNGSGGVSTNGTFAASGPVYAASAYLNTNANIGGDASGVWASWGANDAYTAISARIESRAQAWALQYTANAATGSLASYAFLKCGSSVSPGSGIAGSSLTYSSGGGTPGGGSPAGSWRCMGNTYAGNAAESATLYCRYA